MSETENKSPIKFTYIQRANWLLRLHSMHSILNDEGFSYDSCWRDWEARIQEGQRQEEAKIQARYNKWIAQGVASDHFDPDEHAGVDTWETCRVTHLMYAALATALWAQMEQFLKAIISISDEARGKQKKALEMSRQYCEDRLNGKTSDVGLETCIRELRSILPRPQISFEELIKGVSDAAGSPVNHPEYAYVAALRVVSNAFKHSGGRHHLNQDSAEDRKVASLLETWGMMGKNDEIEYAKLPTEQLVKACDSFCKRILADLEKKLERCPKPNHLFEEAKP